MSKTTIAILSGTIAAALSFALAERATSARVEALSNQVAALSSRSQGERPVARTSPDPRPGAFAPARAALAARPPATSVTDAAGVEPPLTKAEDRRLRRVASEKLEEEFAAEAIDPAWSHQATDDLRQAILSLPPGFGTIASIESRSTHSRIEATFEGTEKYNGFIQTLFLQSRDVSGSYTAPLIPEHGGFFVPRFEPTPDGKLHAVIYVSRPATEAAPPSERG